MERKTLTKSKEWPQRDSTIRRGPSLEVREFPAYFLRRGGGRLAERVSRGKAQHWYFVANSCNGSAVFLDQSANRHAATTLLARQGAKERRSTSRLLCAVDGPD